MTNEAEASASGANMRGGAGGGAGAGRGGTMTAQEVRDTTLMLRRPTVVDALQQAVPKPAGSVPRDGLPFWDAVPLGSKLPIIDHPKDAFVFYRDKLGHGLWRSSPVGEFRLDDPYMHEVDYTYEPVHDPALRRMFRSDEHRKLLISRGFILPTDEAVCSLRQFNTYRRYLQTVYRELIKDQYRRMAVDLSDEQAIRRARQCEERQLALDQRRVEREHKQGELREHLEQERRKKHQQLVARQLHYMELAERMQAAKEEQRREAAERARQLDEKVKHRQAVAAEIRRAKVVATIQAWNREEKERRARLDKQQLQLQEYKEKEVEAQWRAKVEAQVERAERDARLLARQEEALRLAVELRNKMVEREDLRMQGLLKKIKTDQEKVRARRYRFRPRKRKRPCRRTRSAAAHQADGPGRRKRRINSRGLIVDEDVMTPMDQVFNVSMRMVRAGKEQGEQCLVGDNLWAMLRETGFDPSETRDGVPEAVATAIDGLLDSVMEGIVHGMVMQTLKCVYHKVLERCFALLEGLPARELAKRGWVCDHGMLRHSELREKARAREQRECRKGRPEDSSESGAGGTEDTLQTATEVKDDGKGTDTAATPRGTRSPRKQRSARQRILRQIDAVERKNEQLRKALEQSASSTLSVDTDEEARAAAVDLDANFEVMAKSLQRQMVAIAGQSVSEETKLATQHRWKLLKEVELFELVDRLCTLMMSQTPGQFLKSTEFHWAADILARDVMREVRHQVRQTSRRKDRERIRKAREAEASPRGTASASQQPQLKRFRDSTATATATARPSASAHQRPSPRSPRGGGGPGYATASATTTTTTTGVTGTGNTTILEALDESRVPLLRLHKRSPHQPSLPSLDSAE